jgi:hypothetical protein
VSPASVLPDPNVGDRFGKLVVVQLHERHTATVRTKWLLQCDCGRQVVIRYADLRHGRRVSCGCRKLSVAAGGRKQYEPGISQHSRKTVYANFINGAKKRNLDCVLPYSDWEHLLLMPCGYCGGEATGVDRIDSSIGYVPSNVTAACERCNKMKGSQSAMDWYAQIERVLKHTRKREPKRYLEEMKP